MKVIYRTLFVLCFLGCSEDEPLKESDILGKWEYAKNTAAEIVNHQERKEKPAGSVRSSWSTGNYSKIENFEGGQVQVQHFNGSLDEGTWEWESGFFNVNLTGWGIDKNKSSRDYFVISKHISEGGPSVYHSWVYREYYRKVD